MIESINLNLIPSGVSPVCHVSQYDAGRQIKINLFEGINPYTIQSGDAFTLNVRKPDNTIVTTSVSGTQGNTYITISTTEQIAAVVGENLCELKITNGSTVIGTLNFIMQVERDVLADGIPSQSVIEDLDERIAEAIGDNYYNKTETDALLALKADKTEFYNFYPTEQESGAIASFTDGADNIPVKSLVSQIVAVESGSGEKSPTNPYTISGFANGIITRCGKNLYQSGSVTEEFNGTFWSLGGTLGSNVPDGSLVLNAGTYTLSNFPTKEIRRFDESGARVDTSIGTMTFTLTKREKVRFAIVTNSQAYNVQLEVGTATTYEAYNGNTYTFTFGQTVFDCHFDNKGNLVVTKIAHIFDGSESFISLESGTVFAYDFGANTLVNSQVSQGKSLSTHFIEVNSGFGWNSVTSGKFLVAGNRYFAAV